MPAPTNPLTPSVIRRVIILGNTGFIGGHLERFFRQRSPEIEIVGRSFPDFDLTKTEDTFSLAALLDLQTAVVMCSAIKKQLGDTVDAFSQNIQMAINMCHLLQSHPAKRLVFISSAAVYGEDIHNTNITEETLIQPRTYYGIAKYAAESLFRKTVEGQGQTQLVIARPALVYGGGDRSYSYGPCGFIKAALNQEQITLWGDGTELREFVFVEDTAKILYELAVTDREGVFNIASSLSYTYVDALGIIEELVQSKISVTSRPRTKEKVDHQFDNSHLARLLPNIKFTNLAEGIRQTYLSELEQIKLAKTQ